MTYRITHKLTGKPVEGAEPVETEVEAEAIIKFAITLGEDLNYELVIPERVSGDLCRFVPGGVEHYRCDDYFDGTVTNPHGQIITYGPVGAMKGFNR